MASKLSFRSRNLDVYRPLPIYYAEELPEHTELNGIYRSVPAMPTGMEKEEESEKHLQDILVKERNGTDGLYIPTPEAFSVDVNNQYKKMYKSGFKPPRQYIHVQPFPADSEAPSYDMDSEDDEFLEKELKEKRAFKVDALLFEDVIDKLEKNSGLNVVTLREAKLLVPRGDDLIVTIYDYWVTKRLKTRHPLIPVVKSDKNDYGILLTGNTANSNVSSNPYIAFRRRTEKMQTRKNRKNDEASYEKMLKIRRDLNKAVLLMEMVKNRENNKKELVVTTLKIFENRYHSGDFEGKVIEELHAQKIAQRQTLQPNRYAESWVKHHNNFAQNRPSAKLVTTNNDRKRLLKKHPHSNFAKSSTLNRTTLPSVSVTKYNSTNGPEFGTNFGSDEDSDQEKPDFEVLENTQSPFIFRRKQNCLYFKNKSYLPFGILRPSKKIKLESSSSDELVEESSDTSDDDCINGVGRKIVLPSSCSINLKSHSKDYFPCSFHPLPSKTIAFASRRLSRNSRIALDLAQVTSPKKFETERVFKNENDVPNFNDSIMAPKGHHGVNDWSADADDDWFEGLSQNASHQ